MTRNTSGNATREWADRQTPAEHVATRYADLKPRLDAAAALLGMGLTVAAKYVLDEPTGWPTLRQARAWQSSQRQRRSLFDGDV